MTNDSGLFRTAEQLKSDGFYPVNGNHWKRGDELYLPLFEGKMVQAFDHRAASVVVKPENLNRPGQPKDATLGQHSDPSWLPDPRFWVGEDSFDWPETMKWVLGFKEITAATNRRTMIASLFPKSAFGNKLPIFLPIDSGLNAPAVEYNNCAAFLAGNFNTIAFDFVVRQKIQGTTLNWFIVEQLPVIARDGYDRLFGKKTAGELVRDHVLRLTFTADDMSPFARDLGYTGSPFVWDAEERRHLRARLDALYFHLYGLSRDDAGYILDTFPIVPAAGRERVRQLPHKEPNPRLHERPGLPETRRP